MKIETDCASIHSQCKPTTKIKVEGSYEPPDFNELVDDSSNELEIDMSETEKPETTDEEKRNVKKEIKKEKIEEAQTTSYTPFSTTTPTFSATSAFKPPSETKRNLLGSSIPLGPFPAEATFVGYPSIGDASQSEEDKLRNSSSSSFINKIQKEERPPPPVKPTPVAAIGSPEANKQYTILQPAPAGSRAASAIQDIARDGVQIVSAVSSNSNPGSSSEKMGSGAFERPTGTLSPNSMGRGKFLFSLSNFYNHHEISESQQVL